MQFERFPIKSSLPADWIPLMEQLQVPIRRNDNDDFEGSENTNSPD
jgi:hypothetical protein